MKVSEATKFGEIVANARKAKKLNLRECASLILKEDGTPISFQYLSDVENGRRNPPAEHFIKQISAVLHIPEEVLLFHARIFPSNIDANASPESIVIAYKDFVEKLSHKTA